MTTLVELNLSSRVLLDSVAHSVACDRLLRGQRRVRCASRRPLRPLLLAVLPQQSHQPLRHSQGPGLRGLFSTTRTPRRKKVSGLGLEGVFPEPRTPRTAPSTLAEGPVRRHAQSHQPVLLRVGQRTVQEGVRAHSPPRLATRLTCS